MTDEGTLFGSDDSRRSFMKKGALASGALALGGSAIGSAAAQETGGGGTGGADETVLMLHPDAVEDAEFTVASGEVSWSPIGQGGETGGTETTETETQINQNGGGTGTETATDGGETAPTGSAGGGSYTTHLIQYGFSASHVAPVFVPGDVDLSEGDDRRLGEIQEVVEQPGGGMDGETGGTEGGGTGGTGQEGEPLYVRVGLQDGGETPGGAGTPTETETETATETETESPGGTTTDGGETTTTTTEGDGGGLFG